MFQDTLETKNKSFLENFLILENEIHKNIVFSYFYDENDNFEKLIPQKFIENDSEEIKLVFNQI